MSSRHGRAKGPDRHSNRASTACDYCREKKLRCDGLRPACSRCRAKGVHCTFSKHDLRRSAMYLATPSSSSLQAAVSPDSTGQSTSSSSRATYFSVDPTGHDARLSTSVSNLDLLFPPSSHQDEEGGSSNGSSASSSTSNVLQTSPIEGVHSAVNVPMLSSKPALDPTIGTRPSSSSRITVAGTTRGALVPSNPLRQHPPHSADVALDSSIEMLLLSNMADFDWSDLGFQQHQPQAPPEMQSGLPFTPSQHSQQAQSDTLSRGQERIVPPAGALTFTSNTSGDALTLSQSAAPALPWQAYRQDVVPTGIAAVSSSEMSDTRRLFPHKFTWIDEEHASQTQASSASTRTPRRSSTRRATSGSSSQLTRPAQIDISGPLASSPGSELAGAMRDRKGKGKQSQSKVLNATELPHAWVLNELLPIFLRRFGDQFPFLTMDSLVKGVKNDPPPLVVNAVYALAARFSSTVGEALQLDREKAFFYGKEFSERSRPDLERALIDPTEDAIAAVLLLAVHELSQPHADEDELWTFTDVAVRAVRELVQREQVAEEAPTRSASLQPNDSLILLYWSIYAFYQMMCLGSGRKPIFTQSDDADMIMVRTPQKTKHEAGMQRPSVFAHFVQMMDMVERLASLLADKNQDREGDPVGQTRDLLKDLLEWQTDLPEPIRYSHQLASQKQETSLFVQMHLWLYCTLLLVLEDDRDKTTDDGSNGEDVALAEWASQQSVQLLILASAVDPALLHSNPLLSVPLYVARRAEIRRGNRLERNRAPSTSEATAQSTTTSPPPSSLSFLLKQVQSNVRIIEQTLADTQVYWAGISRLARAATM